MLLDFSQVLKNIITIGLKEIRMKLTMHMFSLIGTHYQVWLINSKLKATHKFHRVMNFNESTY